MHKSTLMASLCTLFVSGCGAVDNGEIANDRVSYDAFFPKSIDVFGVSIRGTATTPNDKMLHAAHVMAEYLDNDADGEPDNPAVIAAMRESNATLIMTRDRPELDEFPFEDLPEGDYQDQNGEETRLNARANGEFDASLEEVLHLITHVGYAAAYPEVFGEKPGSKLGDAMDLARGGQFHEIPSAYPAGAWYSYDDHTCDYGCMTTEYMYWAITSKLGAQDFPGRLDQIGNEWRLNTAEKLKSQDPAISALLDDEKYRLPTVLPTGMYRGGPIGFSPVSADAIGVGATIESIDISTTKLRTGNGVEYDFRIFASPQLDGEVARNVVMEFPNGRRTMVTPEYQRFDDGREHEAGLVEDPDTGRQVWMYINIGLPNLASYGPGTYTLHIDSGGEASSVSIPVSEASSEVNMPGFPVVLAPESGSSVSGSVVLEIQAMSQDVHVFLGRRPRDDEEPGDFAEVVESTIKAGATKSESFDLPAGQWGGDLAIASTTSGEVDGVKWRASVGVGTELDIESAN